MLVAHSNYIPIWGIDEQAVPGKLCLWDQAAGTGLLLPKGAGLKLGMLLEREKDRLWFAFSSLGKFNVNPGTKLFTLRRRTSATIWSTLAGLWPSKSLQSRASCSASSAGEVLKSSGWWMMLTLLQNLGENSNLNKVALWKNIYANIYI